MNHILDFDSCDSSLLPCFCRGLFFHRSGIQTAVFFQKIRFSVDSDPSGSHGTVAVKVILFVADLSSAGHQLAVSQIVPFPLTFHPALLELAVSSEIIPFSFTLKQTGF